MKNVDTNLNSTSLKSILYRWEIVLIILLVVVNIINSSISPYYLNARNLLDATTTFLDKAFIVFPMIMVLILGEIDISVGSIVALSSVIMGVLYKSGIPMVISILVCIVLGALCGFFNGYLLSKFNLSSIIVTLSTMIIYRGIAYIILEDQAAGDFPEWFGFFGWGYVGVIPFILICFIITAIVFGLLLHKTTFGRYIYAIGNNITASRFSGVKVDKVKIIVFTLNGLMAAITAIFLTSRMGNTRPNIALGYELDIITMAVFGGVSTAGGKGNIFGPILAIFVIGLLQYGLGLINVPSTTMLVIVGSLLILSVLITNLRFKKA
ncbi:inner-membrane translocator [Caldicellulosiruptor hydrothermalis 108]|uniref:Autoinducer 2 import system permease protein LsrD n=1 Tax=Caldicellulosiruptor hydrothermalis (strain DSM 18901 / VKM B-2411 / 108) TaxID=632292 RepID=E4QDB0_CALH1|nr:ABC transporter permease [Caldicellulosiruptor hydrothermalis]ADQ06405.1 inner-membrane translocator [Caldicellulosiruptor hydrothermalis 108]